MKWLVDGAQESRLCREDMDSMAGGFRMQGEGDGWKEIRRENKTPKAISTVMLASTPDLSVVLKMEVSET